MNIIEEIKKIKSKYGSTYFEKKGLHAVFGDLVNNIDKSFISVLKMADEGSLPEKLNELRDEEDSSRVIIASNLKQDFVENKGLEPKMAALVFDVYLYGLGLKQDLNPLEYIAKQVGNGIQLSELVELALADNRLKKNEMINIFNKGKLYGLSEDEIFDSLVQCIKDYNLKPLPYSNAIQPKSKEILLKYDWVHESILIEELQKAKNIEIDKEREEIRLLAIQKEQALANHREKELEFKRIELELKKKEQEAKEKAERKSLELEKRKEAELKKQKRAQSFNSFLYWFTKKNDKNGSPLFWIIIILIIASILITGNLKNADVETRVKDSQELSFELEKKYELANILISQGDVDSAIVLLQELVHPSDELTRYEKEGILSEKYRYNEYWGMKREELRNKIDGFTSNDNNKNQLKVKYKEQIKKEVTLGKYKVDDYYDGLTPLKEEATLHSLTKVNVNHGAKVDVLNKGKMWWKVKLNNGFVGYIHGSRLISEDELSIPPWVEEGIEKSEWESLRQEGYYESPYITD